MASPAARTGPEPFELVPGTPPGWAERVVPALRQLLVEQAHLEKKAAAAAVSLLFRLPPRPGVPARLSRLAREELSHFERVLRLLAARGQDLVPQRPGAYAEHLKRGISGRMPDRLLDEVLVCALIEARSCERMAALATALAGSDPEAARLYRELVEAEGRHRNDYLAVALAAFPPERVAARWRVLAAHEYDVLRDLPPSPHLHSGIGGAEAGLG